MKKQRTKPKQPQLPIAEKEQFKAKLKRLAGMEFNSLQEFIKTLDALQ